MTTAKKEEKTDQELPEFYKKYRYGKNIPINYDVSFETKPAWYDEAKFRRGQKFAMDHIFSLNIAELVCLFFPMAIETTLRPIIFTGKSSTPYTANQRYLSTGNRVMAWFTGDPFDKNSECHKQISTVMRIHRSAREKLTKASPEDIQKLCELGDGRCPAIWSTSQPALLEDFRASCPASNMIQPTAKDRVWLSQADMSAGQFAFFAFLLMRPERFGLFNVTEEELADYVYAWRVLGYFLGVSDEFNLCSGTLTEVRQRCQDLIDCVFKPALRQVDDTWEHMCRCIVAGYNFYVPGLTFETCVQYMCEMLDIEVNTFSKEVSLTQTFKYWGLRFVFFSMKMPGMTKLYNTLIGWLFTRALDASPEKLESWKNYEFPYMKMEKKLV